MLTSHWNPLNLTDDEFQESDFPGMQTLTECDLDVSKQPDVTDWTDVVREIIDKQETNDWKDIETINLEGFDALGSDLRGILKRFQDRWEDLNDGDKTNYGEGAQLKRDTVQQGMKRLEETILSVGLMKVCLSEIQIASKKMLEIEKRMSETDEKKLKAEQEFLENLEDLVDQLENSRLSEERKVEFLSDLQSKQAQKDLSVALDELRIAYYALILQENKDPAFVDQNDFQKSLNNKEKLIEATLDTLFDFLLKGSLRKCLNQYVIAEKHILERDKMISKKKEKEQEKAGEQINDYLHFKLKISSTYESPIRAGKLKKGNVESVPTNPEHKHKVDLKKFEDLVEAGLTLSDIPSDKNQKIPGSTVVCHSEPSYLYGDFTRKQPLKTVNVVKIYLCSGDLGTGSKWRGVYIWEKLEKTAEIGLKFIGVVMEKRKEPKY